MSKEKLNKLVLSAMFLALGYVLPFITGQIPEIGKALCPMHLPVILCGFICGWPWGLTIGFIVPLLRSVTLGVPVMFPGAVCMAFELAAYGAVSGIMYSLLPKKNVFIYITLIIAMFTGRIVLALAKIVCLGLSGGSFTLAAFLSESVATSIPGIIIQIVLIPICIMVWKRFKTEN